MWSPAAKPIMTFGAQYGGGVNTEYVVFVVYR